MLDRNQIAKVVAFGKDHPVISAIYLFGSQASGHERSKSDVDLGVLFNREVDGFTRINLETELSNLLQKDVDLVDMRKSGPFLRHQIYKHGKSIYRDGTDFSFQFRASSIRDYLDTDQLRRPRRASFLKTD
jgi:predicted nucleotidyltransferase